jgi:glycosyltransferase involved in cell wall biosynthesis
MDNSTVVVTTYNRPEALGCVLASLLNQDSLPGEVVVADDGSGLETAHCIAYWGERAPFPIHHVWQPDQGFRAAAARNRVVARSRGAYLILLDGDCLVFPDFVQRHRELAEPGRFVSDASGNTATLPCPCCISGTGRTTGVKSPLI